MPYFALPEGQGVGSGPGPVKYQLFCCREIFETPPQAGLPDPYQSSRRSFLPRQLTCPRFYKPRQQCHPRGQKVVFFADPQSRHRALIQTRSKAGQNPFPIPDFWSRALDSRVGCRGPKPLEKWPSPYRDPWGGVWAHFSIFRAPKDALLPEPARGRKLRTWISGR